MAHVKGSRVVALLAGLGVLLAGVGTAQAAPGPQAEQGRTVGTVYTRDNAPAAPERGAVMRPCCCLAGARSTGVLPRST